MHYISVDLAYLTNASVALEEALDIALTRLVGDVTDVDTSGHPSSSSAASSSLFSCCRGSFVVCGAV